MTGSKASYKVFAQLVNDGQVKGVEAIELATGFPEAVSIPTEDALDELLGLCQNTKVTEIYQLQSAICLSLGRIVYKQCSNVKVQQISKRALRSRLCHPSNLKSFIQRMGSKVEQTSSIQQKAIYLRALAETGSKFALKYLRPVIQRESSSFVLRASVIHSLRHIALKHPHEVEDLLLAIYNDRLENGKIRIIALSALYSTTPSYQVWRQIAIDLNNETDAHVKSVTYTSMLNLRNITNPCYRHLSMNVSKAIKHTLPFVRNDSFFFIKELMDVDRQVSFLFEVKFAGNMTDRKTFISSNLGTTRYDGLYQSLMETITVSNELMKYTRSLLSRIGPNKVRSFVRESSEGRDTEIGGYTYDRLFERSLFTYFTSADDAQNLRIVQSTFNSLLQVLKGTYTGTYVKAMLPLVTTIEAPTVFGLPVVYCRANDIIIAVQARDLRIEVDPKISSFDDLKNVKTVKLSGTVKPLVRYAKPEMLGIVNPAYMKFIHTGYTTLAAFNAPITAQVRLQCQKDKFEIRSKVKPEVEHMFLHYESYPYTVNYDMRSTSPAYIEKPAQKLLSPSYIKVSRQFGLDTFGIGVELTGKSGNPWALHTIPFFKKMYMPVQQFLPSLLKIAQNPSLEHREVTLIAKRSTQSLTHEIETVFSVSNQSLSLRSLRDRLRDETRRVRLETESEVQYHLNITGSVLFRGNKDRKATGNIIAVKTINGGFITIKATRTPFQQHESQPSTLSGKLVLLDTASPSQSVERSHKSNLDLRWKVDTQPESEINVQGKVEETSLHIQSLEQPDKILAQVVKINCEKMREQMAEESFRKLTVCRYALGNNALVRTGVYNLTHKNVRYNLIPLGQFFTYHLYPYMRLIPQQTHLPSGKVNVELRTLEGIDVTSAKLYWLKHVLYLDHVRHDSPAVNRFLSLFTRLDLNSSIGRPEIRGLRERERRREIFIDETYPSTTQGYSEFESGEVDRRTVRRTRVIERPDTRQICFSVDSWPRCRRDYTPRRTERRSVGYTCFRKEDRKADDMRRRAESEILEELRSEIPDYRRREEIPISCERSL